MEPTVMDDPQPAPRPSMRPTGERERLELLDVLRGFAVLGILVMNIQAFTMPSQAYTNPTNYGDLTGANFLVWGFSRLFFDQKFMALFSMLFGAGMVLMAERVKARGGTPWRLHYRRMVWLLLFGLAHGFLLWFGDILFGYALCAMILYFCWDLRPARQLALGLALLAFPVMVSLTFGAALPHMSEEISQEVVRSWSPPPEDIRRELDAHRGGWTEQMEVRIPLVVSFQVMGFLFFTFGRAGGLMLVGMALFQWGVLSGHAHRKVYLLLLAGGLFVGVPMVLTGMVLDVQHQWAAEVSMFLSLMFNYWGSLPLCLAYLSAIALLHRAGWCRGLWDLLAPAGRMALTCYLGQTLICTTLFYGHGFGLFGRVERTQQLAVTLVIWVVLLLFSHLWLRFFRFGPFEWLWRSLTYRGLQPLRRT